MVVRRLLASPFPFLHVLSLIFNRESTFAIKSKHCLRLRSQKSTYKITQ